MIRTAIFTETDNAVMRQMATGLSMKEMADESGISITAVAIRKRRLFLKIGAKSTTHAGYLIGSKGLIKL